MGREIMVVGEDQTGSPLQDFSLQTCLSVKRLTCGLMWIRGSVSTVFTYRMREECFVPNRRHLV